MSITTRAGKGAPLTHGELDINFTDLRDGLDLRVPKTQNKGIRTDALGTPTFPWRDILSSVHIEGGAGSPIWTAYRGSFKQLKFVLNDQGFFQFHIPHDYVIGSDVYIHTHWSHDSTLVTGGSVTWAWECSVSKGWDQGAFGAPITVTALQNASTIQYRHMIAETALATAGGSGGTLDSALFEPDSLVIGRLYLSANAMTSSGAVPDPFMHQIDLHMQVTEVGTKQKSPPFWT